MKLVVVSKDAIRKRVALYFHHAHGTPLSQLKGTANVRIMHPYTAKSWAQLANVFNKIPWMVELGGLLSPRDMHKYKTINDLTDAIWASANKVVVIALDQPGLDLTSIARLDLTAEKTKPATRRKAKRPPRRGKAAQKKTSQPTRKRAKPTAKRAKPSRNSARSSKRKNQM